jgi:hypothetical protein
LGGLLFGGVEFYSRVGFERFIAERVAALGSGQPTVYTVAMGGHITNGETCAGCATAIVSTPTQAALTGGTATLLVFELRTTAQGMVVSAVLGGPVDDLAGPAIRGGRYQHLLFETFSGPAPSPTAPAVGTGSSPASSVAGVATAGVLLLAFGIGLCWSTQVARRLIRS